MPEKDGVPYILQAHGSIPIFGRKKRKLLFNAFFGNRILKNASRVIALSRVEKVHFERIGIPDYKIVIVPNGIDLFEYSNLGTLGSFKNKYKIGDERKIVLYIGRIHETKRIDLLIRAFAILINTFKDNRLLRR